MKKALFWFKRDLRLEDNCALYHCLNENDSVAPVFIFDKNLLSFTSKQNKKVEFLFYQVQKLKKQLNYNKSDLIILYDNREAIVDIAKKYQVDSVYSNHSYEPDIINSDEFIKEDLENNGIIYKSYKDIVIFEKQEIITDYLLPFTDFNFYENKWYEKLTPLSYASYPSEELLHKLTPFNNKKILSLDILGFEKTGVETSKILSEEQNPSNLLKNFKEHKLKKYSFYKDIPFVNINSYLSIHNKYGTISIREIVRSIMEEDKIDKKECRLWLKNIIKRDFYFQLVYHYPQMLYEPFQEDYKDFSWSNNMEYFQAWCLAQTGYPLVDAAMTQLNNTGYLSYPLRQLVAQFLTQNLNINYQFGEDYFSEVLLDYDKILNNVAWQEVCGCGYSKKIDNHMNINELSQSMDPYAQYIKKYLPIFSNVPYEYILKPWKFKEELLYFGIDLGKNYPYPILKKQD